MSVGDFYDGYAADYHLVYEDWHAAVERQGEVLDRLIRTILPDAADVLDCSCGIGTQALGLARLGYRVQGTDISERSLERARSEAARLGLDISFTVCDFRDLTPVKGDFEVVLSCDNAIPHLLTDSDVSLALTAMRSKLKPGGLLVISVRDYDKALVERPSPATSGLHPGPPRQLVARFHDWEPRGPMHSVHFLVLTEGSNGWTVAHHSTRYRALERKTISRAVEHAGFAHVTWHNADDIGFHQPVMTALAI